MRKIHTRGGKFPSFATPNAHFLQAVCLWQGCSFYFQFGATEFFVAPFLLPNFVVNLPPRGADFALLFPFHSRGVAGFEFPPLLVAFVLFVLVEFAQLVGGVLLNKPFHCFLFAVFQIP